MLEGDNSATNLLWSNLCLVDRNHSRGDTDTKTSDDTTDDKESNTIGGSHEAKQISWHDRYRYATDLHGADSPQDSRELDCGDTRVAIRNETRAQGTNERAKGHGTGDATLVPV